MTADSYVLIRRWRASSRAWMPCSSPSLPRPSSLGGRVDWLMEPSWDGPGTSRDCLGDTNLDFLIFIRDVCYLARSHNFTSLPHQNGSVLLDIDPNFEVVSARDVANKIHARWSDKMNGKYIDITAIHHDLSALTEDGHHCSVRWFPFSLSIDALTWRTPTFSLFRRALSKEQK